MSWFARSIANTLKLDNDDEDDHSPNTNATNPKPESDDDQDQPTAHTPRGVRDDLTELTKTFSRQLWGVASYLAPPPQQEREITDQHQPSENSDQLSDPEEDVIEGIKSDFAEISGRFRSGISKLSTNINVNEFTKIASNFLQFGSESESLDAVGVTEEVVLFARNISMHPETWLDFPVPDDEDFEEFDMSDAQQEHALAVEHLAPRLAALRMELCPGYMTEGCFWKIYFVLLHPRLNKQDAELLSTPQIVEARAMMANQAKAKPELVLSGTDTSYSNKPAGLPYVESVSVPPQAQPESVPLKTSAFEAANSVVAVDVETEKYPVQSTEMKVIDKSVVKEEPVNPTKLQPSLSSTEVLDDKFEDDGDDWLKEESSETVGVSGSTLPLGTDDDVSFSDLEEEDEDVPTNSKKAPSSSDSLKKDSRDWVQLSKSSTDSIKDINPVGVKPANPQQVNPCNPETKESNDWLDFDNFDEI